MRPTLRHQISRLRRPAVAAALAVSASACAVGMASSYPEDGAVRTAEDLPARFVSEDLPADATAMDTLPGAGCRSPLIDPRDGTRLRLVESQRRVGDYEVPAGRYGERGDLLRIECNTGRALGFVPRRR
jgi:hypothetical protein